jgi:hypothetical protein
MNQAFTASALWMIGRGDLDMPVWDLTNQLSGPASERFAQYFNPATPVEYVGNLSAFRQYIERKSLSRLVLGIFGKHISLSSLISALINLPIVNAKTSDTMLNDFVLLFDQHDARKTLMEWLAGEQKRAERGGRLFTSVSHGLWSKSAFYDARPRFGELDSQFILLNGCLCNKEHLRHNGALYQSASKSPCKWVLCDLPPAGMQKDNPEYKGELVFIELDDGFIDVFGGRVPFDSEIGWFPYCTIGGFVSTSRLNSEHFPTLRMSLLFQRRPISPEPHITEIAELLAREHSYPIFLESLGSRILLYYLVPSMYSAWGIDYEHLDRNVVTHLSALFINDKSLLNSHLVSFYETKILNSAGTA